MKKILVVEDGSFMNVLYRSKLESRGHDVTVALDGQDALDKLEKTSPDLIVLDLILPGKDGFYVLDAVKKNEKLKDVPVVIVSNVSKQESIDKAKELGATDYLVKASMTFDELMEKIESYLKN